MPMRIIDQDLWRLKKRYFYTFFVCLLIPRAPLQRRGRASHIRMAKNENFSPPHASIWTLHFSAINFILNWLRESLGGNELGEQEREKAALHSGHLIDFILIAHPSYQTAAETAAKRKLLERSACLYIARMRKASKRTNERSSFSLLLFHHGCYAAGKGRKRGAHTQAGLGAVTPEQHART